MLEELKKPNVDWWERLGGIVGIVSLPVIIWHGCMMQNGNRLSREQFEAAEKHLAEDRGKRALEEKEERRPVMVPAVGTLKFKITKGDDGRDKIDDKIVLTVANIGKSPALNTRCRWEFEERGKRRWVHGLAPLDIRYSACMPGNVVETERVPTERIFWYTEPDEFNVRPRCIGTLHITSDRVDGTLVETQQKFIAQKTHDEHGDWFLLITFGGRSFAEFISEQERSEQLAKQIKPIR